MIDPGVLAQVPGCEDGRLPIIQYGLPGGRGCNDIRYLETAAGRFVLRTRLVPRDRPGADARRELACHGAAAAAGLAPGIVASDPQGNWILMQWLDGRLWQEMDLAMTSAVDHLGERLACLHALPLPAGFEPFDALVLAREQQQLIESQWPRRAEQAAALVESLRLDDEAMAGARLRPVICHGDLQMANCIGYPLRLVDWEYAQIANPAWDLACLITYHPVLELHFERLQAAAGLAGPDARALMAGQKRLFAILNRLWMLAQMRSAG